MTTPVQFCIERLYLSPGHNFYGHEVTAPGRHPLVECTEVECVAGRGLVGDRFFDRKPGFKGQITFLSSEVFEEVCRVLQVTGKTPGVTRRNVITRGVDLNTLIGEEFVLQGIRFEGTGECSPCHWMNHAIALGAEAAMTGRGGLRARILTSGTLRLSTPARFKV